MNLWLIAVLFVVCVVLLVVEWRGVRTTLALHFKGDVKRETRWFAQYGQSACTPVAFVLVWQLDPRHRYAAIPLGVIVAGISIFVMILKRSLGRIRPGRENAGKFTGPSLKHSNHRESFPSSHTACAIALSAVLAHYYPAGASTFWTLAVICGLLRYILDAHWPSDIAAGGLIGYVLAEAGMRAFHV